MWCILKVVIILLAEYLLVNGENGTELVVREKRQYYVCGTYPNQFYSLYPCSVWSRTTTRQPNSQYQCSNGGQKLGVGCYFNYQCTPYSSGMQTTCINNCCCTVPTVTISPYIGLITTTTQSPIATLAYCYNGQRSQVRCTTSTDCASGQTCINNVCCTTTGNEYTGACGGLTAISSCSNNQCGQFNCTSSNYCCECPFGRTSGLCSNGCASGYTCNSNGYCCATCASGRVPYGSCFNGLCASGYTCQAGNICC